MARLYFSTLGFIPNTNRVVIGEDTDFVPGRIWFFDDDGRDGTDHKKPRPFHLKPSYDEPSYSAHNDGEFFLGAVSMGDKLYFASQFLAPTNGVTSTRMHLDNRWGNVGGGRRMLFSRLLIKPGRKFMPWHFYLSPKAGWRAHLFTVSK